ncbi:glycoside hydrolase family 5 protein [Annulohypoxylon maeteangense]|uniref:glycoside hydrolase family 5 protein n=1 Tax=Annulohypoxylon maeteangense TaxID=1927788 RepID=UPI0020079434|nr:glycoside hydrolase family 5 protein [Annulohypoxylon maeteangense]KAI0884535.1 glycoside hydrolase family 5 protein [Annulohypoxylon maeteangense]
MKVSAALWSLSASLVCASWVPASQRLGRDLEPRWQRSANRRQENSTTYGWPYGPFRTKGRDVVNNRDEVITWAGVNWPMSGETMIPEGLEWKSAEDILTDVYGVGFNFIRMGYAIEMVDQIYDRGGEDVPLEVAMIMALGYENGTKVTDQIIDKNPSWTRTTTRFEIWSDITRIASTKGIFVHPDVHVGKAQWCCSHTDGSSWFDDVNFKTANWLRGLSYVANWAKGHNNVVSMSLRNELRESWNRTDLYYNWQTLVGNMSAGADAIFEANPDLLISWSGMQYDQDLSALTTKKNILTAPCYKCTAIRDAARRDPVYFDLDAQPWADKIVWELHLYPMSEDLDTGNCEVIEAGLYRNGFNALGIDKPAGCAITNDCPTAQRLTPVIFSEFGNAQDKSLYASTVQNCIRQFTEKHGVSWMMWSLAGSYRIRSGVQGLVDTWGLTNADWTGWRDAETVTGYWMPWVKNMKLDT